MKFRPCIDIHQGKVKQIVGETLGAANGAVVENFVSKQSPAYYAELFRRDGLSGGHVIMLGPGNEAAALEALCAYPGGLQLGGGIRADNAARYLEAGASHVIVTSYLFEGGDLNMANLLRLVEAVGRERLVIDLSCREQEGAWHVMTDGWKTFTPFRVDAASVRELEQYCSEFLVHAVDVEGKRSGMQERLVANLAEWTSIPCTYAGGARSLDDLERFRTLGGGRLDITIGSALDLFGGDLPYHEVVERCAGS
ncbi:phosphoribosylformimino-5-aminoimidazole carboxamide ribotide isomerase [Paenibacillus sp. IB182496]|uniref:Phosphoribosylformimino-5-aminoimidazole carboxamide ribotide isomerase n=1 Tax=Paenibacillus sabuli TaxID=2772509 RepID=A0A927BUV6_9BACL|nr:phosphoribosylformimino-5-aminoimidazole carboxamide ribotide isomerase [Paenibacillus sabuli]MBD2846085.1 phosphoribosylformimino-5-aminoimidazole carboxamide ribotide isomerase [Paenibacillus sabuli]